MTIGAVPRRDRSKRSIGVSNNLQAQSGVNAVKVVPSGTIWPVVIRLGLLYR